MASFFISIVALENVIGVWYLFFGTMLVVFEFSIAITLFYSEYNNDEFRSFYYCKRGSTDLEFDVSLSESLTNQNAGYSSMKDESMETANKDSITYYTSQSSATSK